MIGPSEEHQALCTRVESRSARVPLWRQYGRMGNILRSRGRALRCVVAADRIGVSSARVHCPFMACRGALSRTAPSTVRQVT